MVTVDRCGKCVVGGHIGQLGLQQGAESTSDRLAVCGVEVEYLLSNPLCEFPRGFSGEGQSKHFAGGDHPVGNEPHHSVRHRFGFATAGAGDDQVGAVRIGLNHPLLLGGRWVRLP